ncbi:hypothetical protein [Cupriavidus consociatus]|uniref:hypothetical protein n=1 Tax=Cupriavidus consociatus TaxID=2821357 RepID=UPI001AE137F9|nr:MULTISPECIES: hypothetical protein [unclassified Cupriavidus]MBP0624107.1 hypothetical protein [Cupriavidus sp. LEh25]MDK2660817.1 hypothetical protein [Cupriavidus sp. LEh21]
MISAFKQKVYAFVAKHGYSYRSYVLSILFLPPAAIYIACKKPGLPVSGRVALGITGVVAPPIVGAATLMLIKTAVETVRQAL